MPDQRDIDLQPPEDPGAQDPPVPAAATTEAISDDPEERHRLTSIEGLAALSLDTLSSVAYGPETIVITLWA